MKPISVDADGQLRLVAYLDQLGEILNNKCRRASFATYAVGLLTEGERKSMEPIAARACGDPAQVDAAHHRLQHFITDSDWSDVDIRRAAAQYGLEAMVGEECVQTWIVDDTGFIKQGSHSVGVQRQYTGSAGKTTNCQLGVSLTLATQTRHLPVDFELYLPRCWAEDARRRREARIPDDVGFRTKPELALEMIRRAVHAGLPRGIVLCDSAYGTSSAFRTELRDLGLDYAVGVDPQTKVWCIDRLLRRRGSALSVRDLAMSLGRKRFRRVTWREGTKQKLWAYFARRRVVPFHDDGVDPSIREDVWLVMEWPQDEEAPTKYYLASLPRRITTKQLVRTIKQRWRTERVYEDFKGELGLDHFEGRRFRGWHHHVSVALCVYAFVVAEQARRFSPQTRGKVPHNAQSLAA